MNVCLFLKHHLQRKQVATTKTHPKLIMSQSLLKRLTFQNATEGDGTFIEVGQSSGYLALVRDNSSDSSLPRINRKWTNKFFPTSQATHTRGSFFTMTFRLRLDFAVSSHQTVPYDCFFCVERKQQMGVSKIGVGPPNHTF